MRDWINARATLPMTSTFHSATSHLCLATSDTRATPDWLVARRGFCSDAAPRGPPGGMAPGWLCLLALAARSRLRRMRSSASLTALHSGCQISDEATTGAHACAHALATVAHGLHHACHKLCHAHRLHNQQVHLTWSDDATKKPSTACIQGDIRYVCRLLEAARRAVGKQCTSEHSQC